MFLFTRSSMYSNWVGAWLVSLTPPAPTSFSCNTDGRILAPRDLLRARNVSSPRNLGGFVPSSRPTCCKCNKSITVLLDLDEYLNYNVVSESCCVVVNCWQAILCLQPNTSRNAKKIYRIRASGARTSSIIYGFTCLARF